MLSYKNMERVAPRQVAYENQLPLAIESKSQRRKFYPEGASTYGPQGNARGFSNTIRIPINADSLLDTQHSYLQFTINNLQGDHDTAGFDVGLPIIKRLRIESAGTTLEDIDNYGKLFGAVLFPAQASAGAVNEYSVAGMGTRQTGVALSNIDAVAAPVVDCAALTDGVIATAALGAFVGDGTDENARIAAAKAAGTTVAQQHIDTAVDAGIARSTADIRTKVNAMTAEGLVGSSYDANTTLGADNAGDGTEHRTFSVALHSGLLNMEKYLPLVMMNAGLVLEIELDRPNSLGSGSSGARDLDWSLTDITYVAHLIDLQRDFYDKLRMVMEGSGGVLQLTGTTFRSYQSNQAADTTSSYNINIPARMKSIKSIFFTNSLTADTNARQLYGIGCALPNGLSEYQFRVGSVVYPAQSVKCGPTNKGEPYQELRKAFGTLGSYEHGGVCLNNSTYYLAGNTGTGTANGNFVMTPYGLDFESFPKTSLENGINSADRSLPITLDIKRANTGVAGAVDVNVFVMCDAVWYVNLDGSVSVSI